MGAAVEMTSSFALLSRRPAVEQVRAAAAIGAVVAASAAAAMAFVGWGDAPAAEAPSPGPGMVLAPPAPPPLLLRDVAPADALSINRAIPLSTEPNPAARPFKLRADGATHERALQCLAEAVYYEAATEPLDGQRAVAQVVLNRVRHPAFVPSVCGVVYHGSTRTTGCQFSFTCDGSLRRTPSVAGWRQARAIAAEALAGAVFRPAGYATHYHADYVVPYWADSLSKNAVIGRHIFYRWPQWWGTPPAFRRRHSGQEADPRQLRALALRRPMEETAPKTELVLATDPRVELASIIQFLAARPPRGEQPSPYEDQVREQFSDFSEHLAVQIYRQLAASDSGFGLDAFLETLMLLSDPPQLAARAAPAPSLVKAIGGRAKLTGFTAALRDFVKHSDFHKFYDKRSRFYSELAARSREPALGLVTQLERDSGKPVAAPRMILAPLLSGAPASLCRTLPEEQPQAWLVMGLRDGLTPSAEDKAQLKKAIATSERSACARSPRLALRTEPGASLARS